MKDSEPIWQAFCDHCDFEETYGSSEEAKEGAQEHHDDSGHDDVWYGWRKHA